MTATFVLLASEQTQRRVISPLLNERCFWEFTWIPFRCRPVWILPRFPVSIHGPLQARQSCFREHLSQALRPHGHSLPCAAPGVTPHEAVPLVDEAFRVPLHGTSHSPNQGVAHLLSHPFNMAKPPFNPEWSQNGHDGRIPDRLGRGLNKSKFIHNN